ncbi:hypothetical protein EBB59_05990 [Lysobacter pythonis]|uniref:Uncharacterized protein n=2 Tax=Solilutibacter pythonis TaxID=2483112 RepID=A0A3M2I0L7_9GAMM|nr:hypothetical protein EBB59_05990 [Lysobacter pythonis]
MLKDYPEHIELLKRTLNRIIEKPMHGSDPFDRAIWLLEGRLETFIQEAREELQAAEASGDAVAIARAEEKISLMRRAHSSNGGMRDLHALRMYFDANKRAFE